MHLAAVQSLRLAAAEAGVDYSGHGLLREYASAGVRAGVCMGIVETGARQGQRRLLASGLLASLNPMRPNLEIELPPRVVYCAGVNPVRLRSAEAAAELDRLESALREDICAGLKLYPGYFPYPVDHPAYEPVYELAAGLGLPVVVHGGETYAYGADDNVAHPAALGTAAKAHPDVCFVLAHLGYPWTAEAATVAREASNVILELSGLVEGGADAVAQACADEGFTAELRSALEIFGDDDRLLFGSDWPLVPIQPYRDFIATLIPDKAQERVFYSNALRVFGALRRLL